MNVPFSNPLSDRALASAIVFGANGAIGSALISALAERFPSAKIYAASRQSASASPHPNVQALQVDAADERQLASKLADVGERVGGSLDLVVNTIGGLHGEELTVEKSLHKVTRQSLLAAFEVNSVIPALIAKHAKMLLKGSTGSVFASLSAKVGSIADNQLGGWYGYRASKAAQNMLLKTMALEFGRTGHRTVAVAIHPGTTVSPLSEPFIRGWPAAKLASPRQCAERLVQVLAGLRAEHSGCFLHHDGSELPW